jgi:hypothetical protein
MVLAAAVTLLLARLAYYHEALERAAMESTPRGIKTGLQVRLAELIIANREGEARELETQDPIRWLDEGRPANYGGAYREPAEAANWYFDAASRQPVSVPAIVWKSTMSPAVRSFASAPCWSGRPSICPAAP